VPQESTGSGFVVSADGLVVTNNHVIEGADRVRVILEGRRYDAHVQGIDTATDVALLKIDIDRSLPYLELGDSDALRVGEWVMVVGSPLQLDQTAGRRRGATASRSPRAGRAASGARRRPGVGRRHIRPAAGGAGGALPRRRSPHPACVPRRARPPAARRPDPAPPHTP
jgi:serine protease Do